MSEINKFNIRVYGILINEKDEVLLVKEKIGNFEFTKFPGGGMEYGEGTRDSLQREFKEETNLDVKIREHIYTTDFFQASAFHKHDQLVAIYYKVHPVKLPVEINLQEFEVIENGKPEYLKFFWIKRNELTEEILTFPIDKLVCKMF